MEGQPTDAEIISSIPDTLPVGIWVARAPGGEFVYANATFQQIMGMAGREDVAAGEYAEPYGIYGTDGELYPEHKMPFVQALSARRTVMVDDIVIHRTDGRHVHVRAYAHPVEANGTIDHVVIAFFDITREVTAERSRDDSEARMQRVQRMESLGNLAGGIAHDFNNLVGAIRTIATSLEEKTDDPEILRGLRSIDAATRSARDLTTALLGFARGQPAPRHEALQLDEVVSRVAALLRRALDPQHELVVQLGTPSAVLGDPVRLEQVVMNLAINARDAMPEGGRLTVGTFEREGRVVLRVCDQGPGIPRELWDKVFEPYFTTRTGPDENGVGLGLATVQGIVRHHGGTVAVVPSEVGACLEVELPAVERPPAPKASATETPPGAEPLPGQRVLVVDDEPLVADAASLALRILGHVPTAVGSGRDAVARLQEDPDAFDVVLLDLSMPGLDGRKTAVALLELQPALRIILASGYPLHHEQEHLQKLGIRAFLDKPYGMSQLGKALGRALRC